MQSFKQCIPRYYFACHWTSTVHRTTVLVPISTVKNWHRSTISTPGGTTKLIICTYDFLLVIHSKVTKHGPISYRSEINDELKITNFSLTEGFPLEFCIVGWAQKTRNTTLSDGLKRCIRLDTTAQRTPGTDRQTEMVKQYCGAILMHNKNHSVVAYMFKIPTTFCEVVSNIERKSTVMMRVLLAWAKWTLDALSVSWNRSMSGMQIFL